MIKQKLCLHNHTILYRRDEPLPRRQPAASAGSLSGCRRVEPEVSCTPLRRWAGVPPGPAYQYLTITLRRYPSVERLLKIGEGMDIILGGPIQRKLQLLRQIGRAHV